jgi:hypothetical protein
VPADGAEFLGLERLQDPVNVTNTAVVKENAGMVKKYFLF